MFHLFEPEERKAAAQNFDVAADGEVMLRDFNPAAANGPWRRSVASFRSP